MSERKHNRQLRSKCMARESQQRSSDELSTLIRAAKSNKRDGFSVKVS